MRPVTEYAVKAGIGFTPISIHACCNCDCMAWHCNQLINRGPDPWSDCPWTAAAAAASFCKLCMGSSDTRLQHMSHHIQAVYSV